MPSHKVSDNSKISYKKQKVLNRQLQSDYNSYLTESDIPFSATTLSSTDNSCVLTGQRRWPSKSLSKLFLGLSGFLIFLLAWHLIATRLLINPVLLPSPSDVAQAAVDLTASGLLFEDIAISLQRVLFGFSIATAFGVTLGILLGASRRLSSLFYPVLETLRPIPPIAWIPLAILWFGIGNSPSYFIVAVGAFFPIFFNSYTSIREVDRRYVEVARCLGASRRMLMVEILLPAALPFILTGLRIGLGIAWMAVVAAELVAAKSGLGYMIQLNRSLLETAKVMVGMITIGILGYFMTIILKYVQKLLIPWQETWASEK